MHEQRATPDTRAWLALAGSPLAIAVGVRIWYGGPPVFSTDDTYIALHTARLLFHGEDPAYPGVPPLTGATSLFHVLILRLFMLVAPPLWAAEIVAWLGALAYVTGAATLIVQRTSSPGSRLACMTIAVTLAATLSHLTSGHDTAWAMAAVVWMLHWLACDPSHRRRVAIGAGLLPWVRPDLAALTLTIALTRRKTVVRDVLLMGLCVLPLLLIYQAAIGRPLPNTIAAKVAFFGFGAYPFVIKVVLAALWLWPWIASQVGFCLAGLGMAWQQRSDRVVVGALILFLASVIVASPNVITHNDYRYLHPLLIPLIVGGLASWAGRPHRHGLVPVVLGLCLLWPVANIPIKVRSIPRYVETVVTAQGEFAAWIDANTRPGVPVLVHDAGYLSEFSHATLTDMVGLKSPASIPAHLRWTAPSRGADRPRAVHQIACENRPEYYVAFSIWEEAFRLTDGLREFGWNPEPILRHVIQTETDPVWFTLYRLSLSPQCPAAPSGAVRLEPGSADTAIRSGRRDSGMVSMADRTAPGS